MRAFPVLPPVKRLTSATVPFPDLGTWQFRINAENSYTDSGTTRATAFGDRVQQINDLVGTNHMVQTTLLNKGVYNPVCNATGKPAVRIPPDTLTKFIVPNSVSIDSRNFSMYIIIRPLSTGEDAYGLFNFGNPSQLNSPMMDFAGGVARSYLPLNSTPSQCFWGNPLLICVTASGTAINTYVNSNKQSLPPYDAATVVGGVICHRGDAYTFKGSDVYEYGLKAGVLSDSEVAQIFAYAQANYSVRTSWDHFFGVTGDSLAEGVTDPGLLGIPHPRIVADTLGPTWKCCNAGIAGLETPAMTVSAVGRLNLQVVGVPGRKVFCFYGGTNDFGQSDVGLATMQSRLTTFINQQVAAGFNEIYVATITPRGDYPGIGSQNWTAGKETKRVDYNAWLRTQVGGLITDVIDLDEVAVVADTTNTTYYATDQLHYQQPLREAIAAKTLSVLGF